MPLLTNIPITIPEKEVLARLNYRRGMTEISSTMQELLDKISREALSLIEPQGIYEITLIKSRTETEIIISDEFKIRSRQVVKLLSNSKQVVLIACTIGPHLGKRVSEYEKNGELHKATILDALGSELADETAQHINNIIVRQAFFSKIKPTMRYSPGYGDWNLDVQPVFLKYIGAERIGLSSNDSHTLVPEKSITALMGMNS